VVDAELNLDDEHPDRDVAVEQEDDDVSAVLGGLDLGQIDRNEARFGVGGERDAERFGEELGAERRAVLEEIDEDLDPPSINSVKRSRSGLSILPHLRLLHPPCLRLSSR